VVPRLKDGAHAGVLSFKVEIAEGHVEYLDKEEYRLLRMTFQCPNLYI
jgi:uncharacterized protein YbcV (DUF1398 family)